METQLTEADCRQAMRQGEFDRALLTARPRVAIILTQSWCPQWLMMRLWLKNLAKDEDIACFWMEYDRESFFEDFMAFKEEHFDNRSVPYVRYYRDGILCDQSNFVGRDVFLRKLKGPPGAG